MEFDSRRYERHAPFVSEQDKLYNARILLAGCGAGSSLAPRLARLGIGIHGKITLADPDTVDITNLNRQEFSEENVGQHKAIALQNRTAEINSDVKTEAITEGITPSNVKDLVTNADVIVDMIDIAAPEVMFTLHDEAKKQHKPVITGLDVGEGIISYVFDYRDETAMTLNRFIGLPEDATIDTVATIPTMPLALQFIMGPTEGVFETVEEAHNYYSTSLDTQSDRLFSSLPQEALNVLPKLFSGELDFVPQTDSAAALLGATHEVLVKEIILGHKVKSAPESIRINLLELVRA